MWKLTKVNDESVYQLDGNKAVISAYVKASGKLEIVLTANSTSGASAENFRTT
jgi:hypothetical protein